MPNPASSGTGFLDVSAWLQIFGEEKGWAYMDALHKNIGSYTHSGSKPCNLAASGEFPIGVSFDYRAAKLKADGAPVEAVFPSEGLGWEVEATAIVKGTKNLEAARKLADFSASREANELYKANFAVLAIPSIATSNPNLPADLTKRMIKNDFTWAATNRDRIIAEWTALRRQVRAEEEVRARFIHLSVSPSVLRRVETLAGGRTEPALPVRHGAPGEARSASGFSHEF